MLTGFTIIVKIRTSNTFITHCFSLDIFILPYKENLRGTLFRMSMRSINTESKKMLSLLNRKKINN